MNIASTPHAAPSLQCNERGILIPANQGIELVHDPSHTFALPDPSTPAQHWAIHARYRRFLPQVDLGDAGSVYQQARALRRILERHAPLSGLLRGLCLPIVIPVLPGESYAARLEQTILPALAASYRNRFPGHRFLNCLNDTTEHLGVLRKANLDCLTNTLAPTPVFGLYFPEALRGWSIKDSRDLMQQFPPNSGVILPDAVIHGLALVGYPDLFFSRFTPGLDCAANTWRSPQGSVSFKAFDGYLELCAARNLAMPLGHYSSGLLFIG